MKLLAAIFALGALALTTACADFYDDGYYGDGYNSGGYYGSYYGGRSYYPYGSYRRYNYDYDRFGRRSYRTYDERGRGRAVIQPGFRGR